MSTYSYQQQKLISVDQSSISVHTNVTWYGDCSSPQEKEGGTGGRGRKINTFLFHRCLCGKCESMVTAEESQCCRELFVFLTGVQTRQG